MKEVIAIFIKETRSTVFKPAFIFVLALCSLYFSIYFISILNQYAIQSQQAQGQMTMTFQENLILPHLSGLNIVLLFICPFLVVRLFSEEYKLHTFSLLLTSPIRSWQIVLGKYASALAAILVLLLVSACYLLIAKWVAAIPLLPILIGYVGIFLLAAVYLAIGLFASSLTSSVFLAGVIAMVLNLTFWLITVFRTSLDGDYSLVVQEVWVGTHLLAFLKTAPSLFNLSVFVSYILFFLFLCFQVIESFRWR